MKILKSKIFTLSAIIIIAIFIIGFCQHSLYNIEKIKTKFPYEQKLESINKIQEISKLRERTLFIIEYEESRMESEKTLAEISSLLGVSILFFSLILIFELYTESKDSNKTFKRDTIKRRAP